MVSVDIINITILTVCSLKKLEKLDPLDPQWNETVEEAYQTFKVNINLTIMIICVY